MRRVDKFGFLSIIVTLTISIISFVTPYWTVSNDGRYHDGLVSVCQQRNCTWRYEMKHKEKHMPAWFKATQSLMAVGLGLCSISLLTATCSMCCCLNRKCNLNALVSGFLVLASASMALGLIVFGVKAEDDWGIKIQNATGTLGWSFWIGIGASAMALLTSVLYCCMRWEEY